LSQSASKGLEPVAASDRIESIDVLRGFALLGILLMNVQMMAMPDPAYFNPTAYGDFEGANFATWVAGRLFADQRFMTIFSLLFGAGIVLMSDRAEARGEASVHRRRMLWLAVFGLLHAHLVWNGDILFLYAVCGLVVHRFRSSSPRRLIAMGLATLAFGSLLQIAAGQAVASFPLEELEAMRRDAWQPTAEMLEADLAAFRGGWLEQLPARSQAAVMFEAVVIPFWGLWRAGGLMLVGMAFGRLGVFGAELAPRVYMGFIAAGLLVGLPVEAIGIRLDLASDWDVLWSMFAGRQLNYWASLPVALAYVGAVMLVCRGRHFRRVTRSLAGAGRTALTGYLLQSFIGTAVFYGHGLGLYGSVGRARQLAVVAAIWIAQVVLATLWLARFQFGPAEWIWRSLTYGRIQPMAR